MGSSPQTPKIMAHCPLCQTAYEERSVRLLGEHGLARMFHFTCRACRHAVLAVILESQNGVSSVGLVTDLEAQDALAMQDAPPITADDCIAAHETLETQSLEVCARLMS